MARRPVWVGERFLRVWGAGYRLVRGLVYPNHRRPDQPPHHLQGGEGVYQQIYRSVNTL